MAPIARWDDLIAYYGTELAQYTDQLKVAGYTTHAVLACRWSPSDRPLFQNYKGDHAEDQVLAGSIWTTDIPNAIGAWTEQNPSPILITLAINRSPCDRCSAKLAKALHDLDKQYSLRTSKQHFILAMRGYYQSGKFMSDGAFDESTVTTTGGLKLMEDAGWKLCILGFDNVLRPRQLVLADWFANRRL